MLALSFLSPLLLWGTALASVPLIIHILNRRRFKTVRWAAMEFLLKAFKENKRRMRFEQWLLLALRMAAVALLAFLLSRPSASSEDLGGLTRRTLHHLVLLDDSASMGERHANTSAFDVARQETQRIAEGLAQQRTGDLFTMFRTSSAKPDFRARRIGQSFGQEVSDLCRQARVTPDRLRLDEVLDRARRIVQEHVSEAQELRIYLLSDLRKVDLVGKGGGLTEDLLKRLRTFDWDRTMLKVFPCGETANENLAVTSIRRKEARSVVGQDSRFEVAVENQGGRASADLELAFALDGGTVLTRPVPSLGPGQRHVEGFKVRLDKAGTHRVEAWIPRDRLDEDDRHALAFPVAESASVLLIDGDPGESEVLAETFYLQYLLDPEGDGSEGFAVTRIDEHQLRDKDLEHFDLVVAANLPGIEEEDRKRLEAWVGAGGGLLLFTGDQVDTRLWNQQLWRDGQGLLPAALLDVDGDLDRPDALVLTDPEHPIFDLARDLLVEILPLTHVGRFHRVAKDAEGAEPDKVPDDTKVLIRVGQEAGAPLMLEKGFGKGLVVLLTTSADASWTSWPGDPSYLPVVRETCLHLMRREDLGPRNLDARGTFVRDLPVADYRPDASLGPVASDERGLIQEQAALADLVEGQQQGQEKLRLAMGPEEGRPWPAAGTYEVTLQRTEGTKEADYFTVSLWDDEGKVEQVAELDFRNGLPAEIQDRTVFIEAKGAQQAGFLVDEGEVWRYMAFVLIGFLLVETLLAWKFGHR
ncbi:MAG: BatA domain-containing protein [Planctomycetota bacterium]